MVGASAGGVEALKALVSNLPPEFPAAVFVTLHTAPQASGALASILNRASPLAAVTAEDQAEIRAGQIYVAPPDYHMLLSERQVLLSHGPKEHNFRPAIDPLFRSAARHFGPRLIGIILSGSLDDGAIGLELIKRAGGIAIVQHPDDALFASMPLSALARVEVNFVLPAPEIPLKLRELVENGMSKARGARSHLVANSANSANASRKKAPDGADDLDAPDRKGRDVQIFSAAVPTSNDQLRQEGEPTDLRPQTLTCPGCGGALWELGKGNDLHYRCHVGHRYTAETLIASQDSTVENALWSAVRALKERAELNRRMANRTKHPQFHEISRNYLERAEVAENQAAEIMKLLLDKPAHKLDTLPESSEPRKRARRGRASKAR